MQFRLVTVHDFAKQKTWPELVPALKVAVENIDMVNGSETSDMKTLNCLLGLQTITKPFQVSNYYLISEENLKEAISVRFLMSWCPSLDKVLDVGLCSIS